MTIKLNHFKLSEFSCKCGCNHLPKDKIMLIMDQVREDYGHSIIISSGKRCAAHNKKIGGAPKSRHVVGDACDLVRTPELLAFLLPRLEHYGLCMEDPDKTPGWIHVDCLKRGSYRVFLP